MRPSHPNALLLAVLLLWLGAFRASQAAAGQLRGPGRYVEAMVSGGVRRTYVLRVPSAASTYRPLPMVIALHGWMGRATLFEDRSNLGEESDRDGFVLVVPNGSGDPQGWNAGFLDLSGKNHDDVRFIDELIDRVEHEVPIDRARVFVAGHSNGAFMAHLLGAKLSNKIAAIAAVAGTIGVPEQDGSYKRIPNPAGPVSVLIIHGRRDRMVQYGPRSAALLHDIGALESAQWWAARDGCATRPTEVRNSRGNVVTDLYPRGQKGTEVELVTINDGDHEWPGGKTDDGVELRTGINAARLIWDFFKSHPKNP